MTDWVAVCGYANSLAPFPDWADAREGYAVHMEASRQIRDAITEAL